MDHQRDYPKLKTLVVRCCETLHKPVTDELVESWWKALRDLDYQPVADRVDDFLARAKEKTPFPRPGQMRPEGIDPPPAGQVAGNPMRDYWRSTVVHGVANELGLTHVTLEQHIVALRDSLGRAMLDLINDMCSQECRDGRTDGMHRACYRRCAEIATAHSQLATPRAPALFKPISEATA